MAIRILICFSFLGLNSQAQIGYRNRFLDLLSLLESRIDSSTNSSSYVVRSRKDSFEVKNARINEVFLKELTQFGFDIISDGGSFHSKHYISKNYSIKNEDTIAIELLHLTFSNRTGELVNFEYSFPITTIDDINLFITKMYWKEIYCENWRYSTHLSNSEKIVDDEHCYQSSKFKIRIRIHKDATKAFLEGSLF